MHPRTPDRARLLARWAAWERAGARRRAHGVGWRHPRGWQACERVARRLARVYLDGARRDLEARGAIVDVSRW